MKPQTKLIIAAAVTGLLSSGHLLAEGKKKGIDPDRKGECHGVNSCSGQGNCGGVHADGTPYSCEGKNKCKGMGWKEMTKAECDKAEAMGGKKKKFVPKKM